MIVSGGHLIGIDHVETDGVSILGDGVLEPLKVNPDAIDYYSAGPGIAFNEGDAIEIENTDHVFYESGYFDVVDDEMSAYIGNNRYIKFDVPEPVKKLTIKVFRTDDESTVSRTKFEFTKLGPESAEIDDVTVLNEGDVECLMMAPMDWPGLVTYQGTVTNDIATIIGYSPIVPEGPILCTEDGTNIVTSDRQKIRYRIVED